MHIIGIGEAGCKIAQHLSTYPAYTTHQIDTHDSDYTNFVALQREGSHEEYESNYKPVDLGDLEGQTTIILSGAGRISGIILRLLQQINDNCSVDILYIKPRQSDMSFLQATRHKICNQVLQQYARSGVINSIILIDNEKIESLIPDISIDNYWTPINKLIGDTFHMINVLKNTEALLKADNQVPATSKIKTLGVVNFVEKQEVLFYDLQHPRAKNYYLALSESYMKDNKSLLADVRSYVKEQEEERCDCAYAIYKTDYEQNYVYGVYHSSFVQEQNLEF